MNGEKTKTKKSGRKTIIVSSIVDALIVLLVPFVLLLLSYESIAVVASKTAEHTLLIFGITTPFCLLTAWRGASHTKRLLSGKMSVLRPLIEGFAFGFVPVFVWSMGNALNVALAAGNAWDGAESWGLKDWLEYTWISVQIAAAIGLFGMLIGGILSIVNRIIIKVAK